MSITARTIYSDQITMGYYSNLLIIINYLYNLFIMYN